jgi:hypothetical protein
MIVIYIAYIDVINITYIDVINITYIMHMVNL